MKLKKIFLAAAFSTASILSYGASDIAIKNAPNAQISSISDQDISSIPISTIITSYESWWSKNKLSLTFEGTTYDLISNDGSGQGSGSIYTSEGIGFGMLTSAMIMYIYQTQPDSGISSDEYTIASDRFMDGYNYWVAAESSEKEISNKSVWACYDDKLLVWTRDSQGNPTEGQTGSALDGDFYMTGAVYIAALAYKQDGNDTEYNELMAWAEARSTDIYSHGFNDNNHSSPFSASDSTPTLPGTGDSTCDKSIDSSQDVQPDKAVLPIMYLFSKDDNMNPTDNTTLWHTLIDNTFNFINVAQEWSATNTNNGNLMYWPYKAHQITNAYVVDSVAGGPDDPSSYTYNYDAGRNAENIGGYLVLSTSDTDANKTAATVGSQLITAVIADPNVNADSFYIGTNLLDIYGLSQQGVTLTADQSTYYDNYKDTAADGAYYNTGHWLMSTLWMHMKLPSSSTSTEEGKKVSSTAK